MSEKGKAPPKKPGRKPKRETAENLIPDIYKAIKDEEFIDPDYFPDDELNISENRYCIEYVACRVQTTAYMRAYKTSNYYAAKANSSRLMNDERIKSRIDNLRADQNVRCANTADAVLLKIVKLSEYDVRDLFDFEGKPKAPQDLNPDLAFAISGVEIHEKIADIGEDEDGNPIPVITRSYKYKLTEKIKAAELLARNHKLLTDKLEIGEGGTQEENDQRAKKVLEEMLKSVKKSE